MSKKANSIRIYRVTGPDTERLVRAASQSAAIRHVTAPYRAEIADGEDIARLVAANVPVETAGQEQTAANTETNQE